MIAVVSLIDCYRYHLKGEQYMVTLKDIAKEAGVSVMTVSRVANKNYTKVSTENISRIEAIIDKYGYVPNSSARSLSSKYSKIIAVIIQGDGNLQESPYNAAMLGNVLQYVQKRGYNTMVHRVSEYSDITKHVQSWKAEGAIFLGTFDSNIRQIQEDNDIPLIFTDSYSSVRQVINVGIDDYKGGVLAARHFIENGHREFAFLGPHYSASQLIQQRYKGFRDTIIKAGFELPPEHLFETIFIEESVDQLCKSVRPITAIFSTSDQFAIDFLDVMKKRGYNIPEDYSIIGFDNLPISRYVTPALTTISQDIDLKAKYALDMLFYHLDNPALPTQNIVLDVELIKRASVSNRTIGKL